MGSDHNAAAVKALAKFAEVRHTDDSIGFTLDIADDSDAGIYYTDPDSKELEDTAWFSRKTLDRYDAATSGIFGR